MMSISEKHSYPEKIYVPFRMLLTFWDWDYLDLESLKYNGIRFTEELNNFFRKRGYESAKIIWLRSELGSLDNFNVLEIDPLDALGDAAAEVLAVKLLIDTISEFLGNEKQADVRRYALGIGYPLRAYQRPEFSPEDIRWERMQEYRTGSFEEHDVFLGRDRTQIVRRQSNVQRNASRNQKLVAAVTLLFALCLIVWNGFQQFQERSQQRDFRNFVVQKLEAEPSSGPSDNGPQQIQLQIELDIAQPAERTEPAATMPTKPASQELFGQSKLVRIGSDD